MVSDYSVRFLLKVLDVEFRFLPYLMTENPTETERNAIICPFLVFCCVSTINFSKSLALFQYRMDKKSSAISIRRQKVTKFLARDVIFYRRIFFADEFSTDEISTDKVISLCNLRLDYLIYAWIT